MSHMKNVYYDGECNIIMITFIIFLALKVMGIVNWSWWIVTLPLWITPAILISFLGIACAIVLICLLVYFLGLLIISIYEGFSK